MIRYALKCAEAHSFESWFQSAEAFDKLQAAGMVACPVCGSAQVEKAVMAPRVRPARSKAASPDQAPAPVPAPPTGADPGPLHQPMSEAEATLAKLRREVEEKSDYVGMGFAAEARKMHEGETPHRSIYGEARTDEAKKLIEDGIPVAPLPFMPTRKTN